LLLRKSVILLQNQSLDEAQEFKSEQRREAKKE
jgi:hypothetical protein